MIWRHARELVSLGVLLVVAPLAAEAQQSEATIRGQVVDTSGRPVKGAEVVLRGTRSGALTAEDGTFTIQGAPIGRHRLEVSRVHFTRTSMVVELSPAEVEQVDFKLKPVPVVVDIAMVGSARSEG